MKEIDEMLNRGIQNSHIRKELRDLIIKEIDREITEMIKKTAEAIKTLKKHETITGALSPDCGPRS